MEQIKAENNCPLNGFKPCEKLKCGWYTQIRGANPNTGEELNHWGCAVAWMPILLIENSQQQRSTGAAVESFRNEMVVANQNSQTLLAHQLGLPTEMVTNGVKQ